MKRAVAIGPPITDRPMDVLAEDAPSAPQFGGLSKFEPGMPLGELRESPLNPRKRFDEGAMRELEASVREKGVLTPLLARPALPGSDATLYEIAAGHRRFRAARAAGLPFVPVLVREMSDPEFLEVLVTENDHREDVHALEEASGYQALLKLPGYDVARIAARVGRSPKYVYDRLKLLDLIPKAQELFLRDLFSPGHAILLARLKPEDQKRAIEIPDDKYGFARTHNLFMSAGSLPFTDEQEEALAKKDPYLRIKAVSVREFEAWIQRSVRFEPDYVDVFLFPEAAQALEAHAEDRHGVILGTRDWRAGDEVRGAGKERVFGGQAWKRADGQMWRPNEGPGGPQRSKTCDHSRLMLLACGPGQGETFLACVNKEKCAIHWAAWQKERTKRQKDGSGGATARGKSERDRWAQEQLEQKEEAARRKAAQERWEKATPAILEAVAAAVRKAPTRAGGLLGKLILEPLVERWSKALAAAANYVPLGRTTEDLVRHAAFIVLADGVLNSWHAPVEFQKLAKALGVDTVKILHAIAPLETVQTSAEAPGKPRRGSCRKCGCTEEKACNGGCGWADKTETRCTACFKPTLKSRGKKKARR